MPMLDVFKDDAFNVVSLTAAILKAPFKPGRIGSLGYFAEEGIPTTTVVVEWKDGQLSLIQTSPRGGPGSTLGATKRTAESFIVPHLERNATILADSIQNVRAFGSENAMEGLQQVVNSRLAELRAMHEVTLEHMRARAIQGIILDADGSTLFNLFTKFGVVQQTADIDITADVRSQIVAAQRLSEADLGSAMVSGYRAFCGDTFFDALVDSDDVKESLKYQESALLRGDLRSGFQFGGVTWENYRGSTGGTPFFALDEAFLVPEGADIFKTYFAPADFIESVNTIGLPLYAKQVVDADLQRHVRIHTQSNPLAICLRPRSVVKLTFTT